MKYHVAVKLVGNNYSLSEFGSLAQAYKYYLEDPSRRMIVREIKPEVVENVQN